MNRAGHLWEPVLSWYDGHARDLPWRRPGTSPWAVLVSEVMLQQTPVARVAPVWAQWLSTWPQPGDLAAAAPAAALRAWGRLGYPRRALRLHQTATTLVEQHGGQVPSQVADLRALPGVGAYTAHAVAAFAFGQAVPVVDTNVARVLTRILDGAALPPPSLARASTLAAQALPAEPLAPLWSVAVMELGALVCTARAPRCDHCPVRQHCRWRAAGYPPYDGPARAGQAWAGTDRECRGVLMRVLRETAGPVPAEQLRLAWADVEQQARCLASLLADGLVEQRDPGTWSLPGEHAPGQGAPGPG